MRNLKLIKGALLMAAGVTLSAGAYAAPSDLQKCGAAHGKAAVGLLAGVVREAARACGAGVAGNPADTTFTAAAKTAGSFDTRVAQGLDKYSLADCVFDIGDFTSPTIFTANEMNALACTNP